MDFDINKYDNRNFHKDELTNKRIKALLLWYEYHSYEKGFGRVKKMKLLDNIINMSIRQEWYEIATFFKEEKNRISKR